MIPYLEKHVFENQVTVLRSYYLSRRYNKVATLKTLK